MSDSEARKIGDLYTGFMDEKKVEEQGLKPIHDELARIDAIKDKAGFLRIVAELQRQGVGGMFRLFVAPDAKRSDREIVYLSQGGLSLPDESYYRDPKFKLIRDAFVEHVERTFALAGRPEPAKAAAQVMELETRLAKHHWDRVKSRDQTLSYNKKDRADLGTLTPGFDWSSYFDGTGAKGISELIVRQPDYFGAMAKAYHEVPLDQWKTWLAWHVIDSAAPYLNKAIVDENFAFARKLTGATELPPALEAGRHAGRGGIGRGGRQAVRRPPFPPRGQGPDEQVWSRT